VQNVISVGVVFGKRVYTRVRLSGAVSTSGAIVTISN
jgi:hypothetical protein